MLDARFMRDEAWCVGLFIELCKNQHSQVPFSFLPKTLYNHWEKQTILASFSVLGEHEPTFCFNKWSTFHIVL